MDGMTLCNFWKQADGTHIIFREKTAEDILKERLAEYDAALVELATLITEE